MQVELLVLGHNQIQARALSSGTRMGISPMPNTGPIASPYQSTLTLYGLPDTTLCTTMPGKHYPNYTVADHEGSTGTPRTSNAPYLPTYP